MKSNDATKKIKSQEQSELINSNNLLKNINSYFIINIIFEYISEKKVIRNDKI